MDHCNNKRAGSGERLVLFDIDGTLMSCDGAGRRALEAVLTPRLGPLAALASWPFGGKTDPQIFAELLEAYGVPAPERPALAAELEPPYLAALARELPLGPGRHLKPGVRPLLAALAQAPGVTLGVLTGNFEAGARLKLEAFGLAEHFVLAATGSDHGDRDRLVGFALARAEAGGRRFAGAEVVLIGDTPKDVACARPWGARCLAVATGAWTASALEAEGPAAVFETLADTEAVLAAIFAPDAAAVTAPASGMR